MVQNISEKNEVDYNIARQQVKEIAEKIAVGKGVLVLILAMGGGSIFYKTIISSLFEVRIHWKCHKECYE